MRLSILSSLRPAGTWLCAAAIAVSTLSGTQSVRAEPSDAETLRTLEGVFRSPAPEAWYGGYGLREFVFRGGRWSLTFTHALDPGMTQRTFQFRTGGGYDVRGVAPEAAPARHVAFEEAWKHVTLFLDDPAMVAAFGFQDCGLTQNLETDISETGCASWKPVADCNQDHDLLLLDGDQLFFGVRPADNDLCTADKTPTALLDPVLSLPAPR